MNYKEQHIKAYIFAKSSAVGSPIWDRSRQIVVVLKTLPVSGRHRHGVCGLGKPASAMYMVHPGKLLYVYPFILAGRLSAEQAVSQTPKNPQFMPLTAAAATLGKLEKFTQTRRQGDTETHTQTDRCTCGWHYKLLIFPIAYKGGPHEPNTNLLSWFTAPFMHQFCCSRSIVPQKIPGRTAAESS